MSVRMNGEGDGGARRWTWRAGYLLAALGVYLLDQASKAWAVRALRYGDDQTIIDGFFKFAYAENRGIAFGQLQEGGAFGRWFLVVLAALAAVAVLVYFLRTPRSDDRVLGACAEEFGEVFGVDGFHFADAADRFDEFFRCQVAAFGVRDSPRFEMRGGFE